MTAAKMRPHNRTPLADSRERHAGGKGQHQRGEERKPRGEGRFHADSYCNPGAATTLASRAASLCFDQGRGGRFQVATRLASGAPSRTWPSTINAAHPTRTSALAKK